MEVTTNSSIGSTYPQEIEVWVMWPAMYVSSVVLLCVEILLSVFANVLLIATICYSPSLKTPPNAQLVSICVNNLLLASSAIISLISLLLPADQPALLSVPADMQLFLTLISLLQYWCIFSAIGFYRNKILQRPSMSVRHRRRIIRCSIWIGWLISVGASLLMTLSYRGHTASITWNPFRSVIPLSELENFHSPKVEQIILLFFIAAGFGIGICAIAMSYHRIFKTLYIARPLSRNRVAPITGRASSISSDDNDLTFASHRIYRPDLETVWSPRSPFTISNGNVSEDMVVHYQRCQEALTLEIYALENPIRVQANKAETHRQLQASLSNASNVSTRSRFIEFNDISPAGELNRIQNIKNSTALRNQSLRRDRLSLKAATRNSLVMLTTYVLLSLPMVLCALPGVIAPASVPGLSLPLLYCRLLFYLNAPAYPVWYLLFSGRVRKCLHKLCDHVLIRLNLKR